MSTMERVTQELLEQSNDESYEGIVKNHWDNCKKLEDELGLTNTDMNPLLLQNLKALFADLLATQRAQLISGLEKKYNQELVQVVRKLNERLQSLGIVFQLYADNNLHVSIYGQELSHYYLDDVSKDVALIVQKGHAPVVEKLIRIVNSYNKNPDKNYFKIEKLKQLVTSFEKLFIDTRMYYGEATNFQKAEECMPREKKLAMLAPHPEPGCHIRMYVRNSKGQLKTFTLGFTVEGKITFTPDWWVENGHIRMNTEKASREYDSLANLIKDQKKFLMFRLEIDHPQDVRDEAPGNFTDKQFQRWSKLLDEIEHLSPQALVERIENQCSKLPNYDLLAFESKKSSQKMLRHGP